MVVGNNLHHLFKRKENFMLLEAILPAALSAVGSMFMTDYNMNKQKSLMDYAAGYNDPVSMMQRMRDAGITPGAAAQGISGSPGSGQMATNSAQSNESQLGDYIFNLKEMQANVNKLNAEADKIATENDFTSVQRNFFIDTYDTMIKIKNEELHKLSAEINNINAQTSKTIKDKEQVEWLNNFCKKHNIDPSNYGWQNLLTMFGEDKLNKVFQSLSNLIETKINDAQDKYDKRHPKKIQYEYNPKNDYILESFRQHNDVTSYKHEIWQHTMKNGYWGD